MMCLCREDGCGIYDVLYEDVITANSAKPVLTASDFQERAQCQVGPCTSTSGFRLTRSASLVMCYQVLIIAKL